MTFTETLTSVSIAWVAVAIGYIVTRTIITVRRDR